MVAVVWQRSVEDRSADRAFTGFRRGGIFCGLSKVWSGSSGSVVGCC